MAITPPHSFITLKAKIMAGITYPHNSFIQALVTANKTFSHALARNYPRNVNLCQFVYTLFLHLFIINDFRLFVLFLLQQLLIQLLGVARAKFAQGLSLPQQVACACG